ncbi:MAG: class I SAM-dependent methyltransferase [Patescibacteria group bacterium]
MDAKIALEKIYRLFGHLSFQYKIDFKRFLISLNLLSSLGAIKGKKILDVGSGIGILVGALGILEADAVGVDKFIFQDEKQNFYTISDFKKLESIWQEGKIKIIKSDIVNEPLPFPDETFDVVVSDATIEHLPDSPKDLFLEVRRVLKKDGFFLVTTPNLANLLRCLRFFLLGRSPNWDVKDFFESGSNFKGHRREFTLDEVVKILEWSFFAVLQKNTRNVFFSLGRFFQRKNFFAQLCSTLSIPFSRRREMIYVLAKKE